MLIKRLNYLSHLIRVSLWLTLSSICFYSLYGQNDRLASLNPSDLFLQTYIYERDGKALISDSKYDSAIEKFSKATHLLNTLNVNYPTWRPDYVKKAYDRVAILTQETLKAKESENSPSSATPSLYSEGKDSGERAKERAQDILKNDKRLSEITKRLADIQEQIDNKQSKLKAQEKEEASRNEVIADLKKKDAELSAEKERAKKEKSDFEKRQKALTSEVNILRIQLDENAKKQQQKEADFKDELLSAIRSKNAEIALLEKNTSEIQGENKAPQEALHKEISSLKSELKEMSTANSGLKQKEQEASKLKEELTFLLSENETISARQQESEKARKSIEGQLDSLNLENEQLKKSLGNAGSSFVLQVDDLNKQMLALKQERDLVEASKNESIANVEKLTQLLAKEKSAHLAEIQEQKTNINRLTEKVEDLSAINTKNAENDLLKKNASEMQAKTKARQEALNEEISTLRSALKGKYDNSLDFKQKELEASKLEEELISLRGENESIAEQQRESEKARKKLEGDLASVDQENEQLKASLKTTVDSFGNQVDTLNKEKLSLKKERNYAEASRDESFANVKKLTQLLEKEKGAYLLETEKNRTEYLANIQVQEKRINALNQKIEDLGKNHKSIRQKSDDEIASLRSQAEGNLRSIASLQGKLQTALKSADEQEAYSKQKILTLNQSLKDASKQQDHSLMALQDASDTNVKLQDQITALQQEKSILLTRPLRSEIEALQEDLQDTENAKKSLSLNLSRNEAKYFTALDRIKKLQRELETSRVAASRLEISFDEEREMSSVVIKSQRERLTQQNKELAQVNRQLASEEAKVIQLQKLVDETKEHYKDVKGKHDNLLVEHQQLKLLLGSDKKEDLLKKENLALKADLRASRKRFEEALKNKNTEKEDLLIARKQYALIRTDLIKKKHQLELSNLRGDKLVRKLQDAEAELKLVEEATDAQYSSEEVAMLKDLLQKNVKLQKNRQITRSLILEELKHLGIDDTNFLAALDLQETQELVLSEDQKRLLANPDADGEFRFTDRALPEERKRAEQALNQRLNVHDKLGRSAYKKGHYLAAEEFFKINLDDHPGHIPSMLNLGVARLRKAQSSSGSTEDLEGAITSFEDALAMRGDDGLPYALQMLGYAQYLQGNDQKATEHFLQCLSADPNNAKAHIFLGALMADQNDLKSSETHLRKALKISHTLTEPLYNLALLLINQGKYNEALQNYREALQKGAPSDPALEKQLRKALPQVSFQ